MNSVNGQPSAAGANERDLFLAALEHTTPEARAAFLDRACRNDPALRAALEQLLRNHKEDHFLETPAVTLPPHSALKAGLANEGLERPGDRIGPYKLLQEIGEGGCGTVFMAEQESPVRRRVALKIIKPGMDTKSVIARFESERQALAMMDHPNIAKVLDAGATSNGRPYFVMELVRGVRITEYCEQNHFDSAERLRLFVKVCHAIQHAHQKGIIHRDIKPSNILVTLHDGEPVPKIIDFGIAKATGQRLTDKTVFTEPQAFVGTPAYTSPEQIEMSGLDIDTRSDIYSLGVLLYELLTGKTPFDGRELVASGIDAMRKTIREKEPERPSARLSQTLADAARAARAALEPGSAKRSSGAREAVSRLRGDLDWIVMKCLEKDRSRRYETVNALALDIERHMNNEPVYACPPSPGYQFLKFARRNRLVFTAASAFAGALILGLALAAWQYVEKSKAYRRVLAAEHQQQLLLEKMKQANAAEMQLRREAEIQELASRHKAYAADINLLHQALGENNLGRAQALLRAQAPKPGQPDLRGWEWRYLWQNCQSDALFTLCDLTNEISCLTASSDGKWVAVVETFNGGLSVWDLRAHQEIARIKTGVNRALAAFSPVGSLLAFSSQDNNGRRGMQGRIRFWDVSDRRYLADLPIEGSCRSLAFSADGKTLAVSIADNTLSFWNVADGKMLESHTFPQPSPHPGSSSSPQMGWRSSVTKMSSDFRLVAEGGGDGRLRVWDITEGRELWSRQASDETIMALAFSPDGRILASGAGFTESVVHVWDAKTGEELAQLEGHHTFIPALVFWPDGSKLASASGDQTIRIWDVSGLGQGRARVESRPPSRRQRVERTNPRHLATLRGHQLEVWSLALLPDATTLVSGCKDGTVLVWDTGSLPRDKTQIVLPEQIRNWSFAPDSQSILAVDQHRRIVRFSGVDFQDKQAVLELGDNVFDPAISADGHFAAALVPPGILRVWDLEQKTAFKDLRVEGMPLISYAFDPPGKTLFVCQNAGSSIQQWDIMTGQITRSWSVSSEPGTRYNVTFSPDVQWAFRNSHDNREGVAKLLFLPTGQEKNLDLDLKQVSRPAISPNNKYLAVVSGSGSGYLYDLASAQKLVILSGFLQGMTSCAFSPDDKRLAIGGNAREAVRLWDTSRFHPLLTLEGQGSFFAPTAFSPDGNILASSNMRGTLYLWRAPSMEDIQRLEAR
jgi:WD40 repeat protein/serine/threonine protein kinase